MEENQNNTPQELIYGLNDRPPLKDISLQLYNTCWLSSLPLLRLRLSLPEP